MDKATQIKEIEKLNQRISELPNGYISKKMISGHLRYYLQWKEANKVKSKYIKESEYDYYVNAIEERKGLQIEVLRMTEQCKIWNNNLSSTNSMRVSLDALRGGEAGLSAVRQAMLDRVPKSEDWAAFAVGKVEIKDLAYLSAYTQHEFALLRGKNHDILFHGTRHHCTFTDELMTLLEGHKLELVAHSHGDYPMVVPSPDDRRFLKRIGQERSSIISHITGEISSFSQNMFE